MTYIGCAAALTIKYQFKSINVKSHNLFNVKMKENVELKYQFTLKKNMVLDQLIAYAMP